MTVEPYRAIFFFFFNDTATTEIYTLSLHDALPISGGWCGSTRHAGRLRQAGARGLHHDRRRGVGPVRRHRVLRSEEHTSELQSSQISYAVFCLKKKKKDAVDPLGNIHSVSACVTSF